MLDQRLWRLRRKETGKTFPCHFRIQLRQLSRQMVLNRNWSLVQSWKVFYHLQWQDSLRKDHCKYTIVYWCGRNWKVNRVQEMARLRKGWVAICTWSNDERKTNEQSLAPNQDRESLLLIWADQLLHRNPVCDRCLCVFHQQLLSSIFQPYLHLVRRIHNH